MQTADSSEVFSDYQESLPAFDADFNEATMSPGLLMAQQLQQSTTKLIERAPAKKPPHFKLPVTGEDDTDSAFPFQLGTNASLPKTSKRLADLGNGARERRSVSCSAGQPTPEREIRNESRSLGTAPVSPRQPLVQEDKQGQLGSQSPRQAPDSSPDRRENAGVNENADSGEQQTGYIHEQGFIPVASVVTPDRAISQPREHEPTSSHHSHSSPQHCTNGNDLSTSASTVCSKQDQFLVDSTEPLGMGKGPVPTEEDLLMLLNRRNKSRMQENARLVSYSRSVQSQNLALLKDRKAAIEQIDRMSSDLEAARQHNTTLESQMGTFQTKYTKLKTWAIEMNQEYVLLDAARGRINTSLAEAKQDHIKLTQDAKEAQAVHDRAAGNLTQLRQELRDTKEEITRNGKDTAVLKTKLDHATKSLQQERARTQQYLEHIRQLTQAQSKTEQLIGQMTTTLTSTCEKVCINLQHGMVDKSDKKLDECLSTLHGIQQALQAHVAAKPAHEQCTDLADAQTGITESIMVHLNPVLSGFIDLNTGHMQEILRAVQDLGPGVAREKSLIKSNATLEERQRAMGKVETMLRGDKTAAMLHLTGLLEVHKQLLVNSNQAAEIPKTSENQELRSRCDQLQLLHAQKTYELTRVQQQLDFHKQCAAKADIDTRTTTTNMQKALSDAQNGFQEKLDQELKSKETALLNLSHQHRMVLSTRDQELQTIRLELDREHVRCEDLTEQIKQLNHETKQQNLLLSAQQDLTSLAKVELAKLKADKSHYDQQLAVAKTQTDRIPFLEGQVKELHDANAESSRHKQRAEMLEEKLLSLEAQMADKLAELRASELQATVLGEEVKALQNGKETFQSITSQVKELLSGLNNVRSEDSQNCDSFKTAVAHQNDTTQPNDVSQLTQAAPEEVFESQHQIQDLQTGPNALQVAAAEESSLASLAPEFIDAFAPSQESLIAQALEVHENANDETCRSNTLERLPGSVFDDEQEDVIVDFSQDVVLSQPNIKDRRYEISSSIFCTPDLPILQMVGGSNPVAPFERAVSAVTATISPTHNSMMMINEKPAGVSAQCGRSDSPLSEHNSWFDEIDPENHNGKGIDEADFDDDDFDAEFDADEINAVATVNMRQATTLTRMQRTSSLSDDMLLRSSLPPSRGSAATITKIGRPQLQVRAQTPQKSPVKLRSGHQVQLAARPPSRDLGRRESTPQPTDREPTRPNSAAKRRSTAVAEPEPKRIKQGADKVNVPRPTSQAAATKPVGDWTDLSRQLPVGSRSSGSVFKPQATAATKSKPSKFKTARKSAKDNKYSQRFSSQV